MYNVAGPNTSLAKVADQVRQYIPSAKIEFGGESGELPHPKYISSARAKQEFGITLMSLQDMVLSQINEARGEVGFEPIKA